MNESPISPTIEADGWVLVSAEERAAAAPDTFYIPSRAARESLHPGDGVKLLFDIETREGGQIVDRGVDRMWVIVKAKTGNSYVGILDSDPGAVENLKLRERDLVTFGPEHVANISRPPRDYVVKKYGASFSESEITVGRMAEGVIGLPNDRSHATFRFARYHASICSPFQCSTPSNFAA
jgi:hypothetical protein